IGLRQDVQRGEVRDERYREEIRKEAPKPGVVDVDGKLREELAAVAERVRRLAAFHRPERDADGRDPNGSKDGGRGGYRQNEHDHPAGIPGDVQLREAVGQDDEAPGGLAEPAELEVAGEDLEARSARPDEQEIEVAVANEARKVVEVSEDQIRDRECEAADAVEQGHFGHRPRSELGNVGEDHEDGDEIDRKSVV